MKGRFRLAGAAVTAALVVFGLSACAPGDVTITTSPALYPAAFRTGVTDYVNRCDPASPTEVNVTAPAGTTVSIDGSPPRGGTFTTEVTQAVGRRFTIDVVTDGRTRTHHVRCLPADFPRWSAAHIPVTETTQPWRDVERTDPPHYRPWHFNSVEDAGDGYIISFRHLDAVIKIDKLTGAIVWKLSGTERPESLALVGDPLNGTSGQHDARLLGNGTVTMHDNGTLGLGPSRRPRSIGYRVDTDAMTATLVEDVRDLTRPTFCCGSTRVLPQGNRVIGWGGTNTITENRPDGSRVFRLDSSFVYRAIPLFTSQYTPAQFRAGMDAQYPT